MYLVNYRFPGRLGFGVVANQAPKSLIVSLSLAILIRGSRGSRSSLFSFRVAAILALCFGVPTSIISVFSVLNFAPDALHHSSRVSLTYCSPCCLLGEQARVGGIQAYNRLPIYSWYI